MRRFRDQQIVLIILFCLSVIVLVSFSLNEHLQEAKISTSPVQKAHRPTPPAPSPSPPKSVSEFKENKALDRSTPQAATTFEIGRDCDFFQSIGAVVSVSNEEIPVRSSPTQNARPITDLKGDERLLDPRYDLRILEEKGDWVRVTTILPQWPPGAAGWTGWIEKKDIQKVATLEERACLFVDLSQWQGVPPDRQSSMREAAFRILRQDKRCRRISRGGFWGNGQRFYLTCYPADGGKPYHYWLSASTISRDFTPPQPVEDAAAMSLCHAELKKMLKNKVVVDGTPEAEINVGAFSAYMSRSVHYVTLEYRTDEEAEKQAYCLVAPGGGAEITLMTP